MVLTRAAEAGWRCGYAAADGAQPAEAEVTPGTRRAKCRSAERAAGAAGGQGDHGRVRGRWHGRSDVAEEGAEAQGVDAAVGPNLWIVLITVSFEVRT